MSAELEARYDPGGQKETRIIRTSVYGWSTVRLRSLPYLRLCFHRTSTVLEYGWLRLSYGCFTLILRLFYAYFTAGYGYFTGGIRLVYGYFTAGVRLFQGQGTGKLTAKKYQR
jgi:hypothetical protein